MDGEDPESISGGLARKIRADLRRALDIVELLDGRGGVLDGTVNRSYRVRRGRAYSVLRCRSGS